MDKSLIDEISSKADIVSVVGSYLNLQRKGRIYVALCPFHDDNNPSLQVDPERNTFHCWVDGHYGNSFSFVMQYENVNFIEAVKKVASIINFDDERLHYNKKINYEEKKLFDCINDLSLYYEYSLLSSEEGEKALNYLNNERKLSNEIIKKFRIGYAVKNGTMPILFLKNKGYSIKTIEDIGVATIYGTKVYDRNQGRIVFPIFNQDNQIVGFSARALDNDNNLKYVNSPETKIFLKKNILYNFYNAKTESKRCGYIFLLEGFMDVIALEKMGFSNAVALMGTSITKQHIFLLKKMNVEVRIFLDGDNAGQEATWKIMKCLLENNIDVRIVSNDTNLDPDELVNEKGIEYTKKILLNLLTPLDFAVKYYKNNKSIDNFSSSEREKIIDFFMPIIASIKSSLVLDDCIMKLQNITNFHYLAIKKKIEDFVQKKDSYYIKNIYKKKYDYKFEKTKSGILKKTEQKILFYMFLYVDVANFYKSNIGYFYTDTYRELAGFILNQYEISDKININTLITDIEMSNVNNKEDLKKEIFFFNIWKKKQLNYLNCPDLNVLNDYKNKLDKLKKQIDYEKVISNVTNSKNDEEMMKIYKDIKYENEKK